FDFFRRLLRFASGFAADEGKLAKEIYHKLNFGIAALLPIAFVAPSALSTPIDLVLSFALPLHGHIGMNYVISDYVPKHMRRMARAGVLGVSLLMAAGLLKLSFGPGITKSLKNLWEPKKAEQKTEKKDHKKK